MKSKRLFMLIIIVLLLVCSIFFIFSHILVSKKENGQNTKANQDILNNAIQLFKKANYQATLSYSVNDDKLPEVNSKVLYYRYRDGIEEYFGGEKSYLYIDFNNKKKYEIDKGKLKIKKTSILSHSELLIDLLKSSKINRFDENTFELKVDSKLVEKYINNFSEHDSTIISYDSNADYFMIVNIKEKDIFYVAIVDQNHKENNIVIQFDSINQIQNITLPKANDFKEERRS